MTVDDCITGLAGTVAVAVAVCGIVAAGTGGSAGADTYDTGAAAVVVTGPPPTAGCAPTAGVAAVAVAVAEVGTAGAGVVGVEAIVAPPPP